MRDLRRHFSAVLLLACTTPTVADTINLNPGDSIASAVNAASPGDEIVLAPGTYTVFGFQISTGRLTIRGSGGSAVTTIEGGGPIWFTGRRLTLEGVTIAGFGSSGYLVQGDEALFRDVVFKIGENAVLIQNDGGRCVFDSCVFTDLNVAAALNTGTAATFLGCSFVDNDPGSNGTIYVDDADATLIDCVLEDNSAEGGYSGIRVVGSQSRLTVTGGRFERNTTTGNPMLGGAISSEGGSLEVSGVTFRDNETEADGAAIFISSDSRISDVVIDGCLFAGNTSVGTSDVHSLTPDGLIFTNNVVIASSFSPQAVLIHNSSEDAEYTVANNTFIRTTTTAPCAINAYPDGAIRVFNNVFNGFGTRIIQNGWYWTDLSVDRSDIRQNLIRDYFPQAGDGIDPSNFGGRPTFVDEANSDYRLAAGSVGIDAGSNALITRDSVDRDADHDAFEPGPFDHAGAARVADGDGDGVATVDVGAFEYSEPETGSCTLADVAEPFGVLDLSDLSAFVQSFVAGCP